MRVELKAQITTDTADTLIVPCLKNQALSPELQSRFEKAGISSAELLKDYCGEFKEVFWTYLPWENGSSKRVFLLGLEKTRGSSKCSPPCAALSTATGRNSPLP